MNDILQPGMHPDADRLSTFVEGAASARERKVMLVHLAECGQCRRIVFLMKGEEESPAPAEEAPKRWTWGWLMPAGLAGAALACGIVVVLYLHTHHAPGEIAVNNAPVQAPYAAKREAPAAAARAEIAPRAEMRGGEQARAGVAGSGSGKTAGMAGAMAPVAPPRGNTDGTVVAGLKPENAPPPAAAPPAPAPIPATSEAQPKAAEAKNAVAPGFAAPQSLPALRIVHDRGPDDGTSQVSGLVTDQTGAAVGGATVTLRDQTGKTRETTSGGDGSFNLAGVAPGQYELKVMAQGFEAYQQAMDLKPRDMAMLDTRLTLGAESQTVTVQANALEVQTDSNVVSTLSSEKVGEIETKNRNFAALSSVGMQTGMAELPSHKPAAMTVARDKLVLSLDNAGTLFASRDGGRKWKKVKPQWTGKVARIESVKGETPDEKLKKKTAAKNAPGVFQLTTENGAVWMSEDGTHWRAR